VGRVCRTCLAALLLFALPWRGAADSRGDSLDADVVSIVPLERRVLAVNPVTGPVAETQLGLNEAFLGYRTHGRLGVAATNRRLLGITSRSAVWAELRLRVSEAEHEPEMVVEERVAVVRLPSRIAGITSASPVWHDVELTGDEYVREIVSAAQVAAVVTNRRVLGFAAGSGFVSEPLGANERLERSSADDRSVQLVTSDRVLVFQQGARRWTWVRN
jgi:hypothetical protein